MADCNKLYWVLTQLRGSIISDPVNCKTFYKDATLLNGTINQITNNSKDWTLRKISQQMSCEMREFFVNSAILVGRDG